MGYYSKRRRLTEQERYLGRLEVLLIVLCVAAIVTLVIWIISTAGGGALMT